MSESAEKLRASGIVLSLEAWNPDELQEVEGAPLGQTLGHSHIFFNLGRRLRHIWLSSD